MFTTLRIPGHHACRGWNLRVPIPSLKDLFDEEIYGSYNVPSDRELEGGSFDDPILARIITGTRSRKRGVRVVQRHIPGPEDDQPARVYPKRILYLEPREVGCLDPHYKMESSRIKYFKYGPSSPFLLSGCV